MKRVLILLIFGLGIAWTAWAADNESVVDKTEKGIKTGTQAAARGIETGVEAASSGVKKGVEATGKGLKKAGDWIEEKILGRTTGQPSAKPNPDTSSK
jgi:hypothetical protein